MAWIAFWMNNWGIVTQADATLSERAVYTVRAIEVDRWGLASSEGPATSLTVSERFGTTLTTGEEAAP